MDRETIKKIVIALVIVFICGGFWVYKDAIINKLKNIFKREKV